MTEQVLIYDPTHGCALDFVCPVNYKEIDVLTCETFSFGKGCKNLATCRPYNDYVSKSSVEKLMEVEDL